MSAFPAHHETPQRTWWSLSSKAPNSSNGMVQDLRRSYSTGKSPRQSPTKSSTLSFNALASAMGFKSKKHPSLTIQEPPLPIRTVLSTSVADSPYTTKYANRPPSKTISSTGSRADSFEPRTPVDGQREARRSLLTLSDVDPFAGRGISAPQTPSDPSRLSVYSNPSIPEIYSKKTEPPMFNRVSYASSSSHSNFHGGDLSPLSSTLSTMSISDSVPQRKLPVKRSLGSLHQKPSFITADEPLVSAWEGLTQVSMSKSASSSTLTDKNRLSQPAPPLNPRPPLRARGMTDGGTNQHAVFLSNDVISSKVALTPKPTPPSPNPRPPIIPTRAVIRQTSGSRVGSPPSAPPKHELPPPPPIDHESKDDGSEPVVDTSAGSGSSSSLSFASSTSSNKETYPTQPYSPRQKEKKSSERSVLSSNKAEMDWDRESGHTFSKAPSAAPRTLKKALSHQSLVKRGPSHQSPTSTPPSEPVMEKVLRKQRSFHQPKIPMPPILFPIRHTNPSVGPASLAPSNDNGSVFEQRRGSAGGSSSVPGRKRLFSGSSHRRPSTSQCILSEDDTVSVFSLRSDKEQIFGSSFSKPLSPAHSSSFWDEGTHDHAPGSPILTAHEYTPQQIMSPAEMAKVEASVEESSIHIRERGLSALSFSTENPDEGAKSNPTPQPCTSDTERPSILPMRSNSLLYRGPIAPPRLSLRPSTSQANITVPSSTDRIAPKPSSSPPQAMASLPPPPRPRPWQRPTLVMPPEDSFGITPLPPPPARRNLRAKVSAEKALHRRSIMKKPSFLDIDDESDKDSDVASVGGPLNDSFLDLARESFDTVRSISE